MKFDHKKIESKWQKFWEENKAFEVKEDKDKKKYYVLVEFPYPSGAGLHVGHCRSYSALDAVSRMKRMQGLNVMFPIGWDAFGLPTENYAIKHKIHPRKATDENIKNFRRQCKSMGFSFDWSREVDTTDPAYYKWTQWIFLKLYEKGLAYKNKMSINWCKSCKIGLANEEVVNGVCERCGGEVIKKEKEQWMLAITKYADRLIRDLDKVDYLEKIKTQQINWIGKSDGSEIDFKIKDYNYSLKVFTTRADTLFGCTYMVVAPEHELLKKCKEKIKNLNEIEKYIDDSKKKSDLERTDLSKDKSGALISGVVAINPVNDEEIPVFVADYVLPHYGTGAIMAVPAHDERDYEFAKKYDLPIREVVIPVRHDIINPPRENKKNTFREIILAIVFNPKNNKYLCLKWNDFNWITFITGGVEKNENIIDAAKREILEETGYKNVRFVKKLGGKIESHFFAAHKDVNRRVYNQPVYFELINEDKVDVSDKEKSIHKVIWLSEKDLINKRLRHAEFDLLWKRVKEKNSFYTGKGVLINSGKFNGLESDNAKYQITNYVNGKKTVNYKLRDWVFSRQHYWGEPIPMIKCDKCGWVPVPESELPIKLPNVEHYEPTVNGDSPLAKINNWVKVKCPKCGLSAKRETDTMPNWAGSSWYFLRYCDPNNNTEMADNHKLKYWLPVDLYNGGMEHTTLHLLYSRFWHKFLYDIGVVPTLEPYKKRISHGMVLAEDGSKMSKSKGNVVNPDEYTKRYGADTLRIYEMFMGPFSEAIAWDANGAKGVRRFLDKVYNYVCSLGKKSIDSKDSQATIQLNKTILKVSTDLDNFSFNTAVSQLMIFMNYVTKNKVLLTIDQVKSFLKILSPFAPHLSEELWSCVGGTELISLSDWPEAEKIVEDSIVKIAVMVNGKKRGLVRLDSNNRYSDEDIFKEICKDKNVSTHLKDKNIKKIIYIPGKIVSVVL